MSNTSKPENTVHKLLPAFKERKRRNQKNEPEKKDPVKINPKVKVTAKETAIDFLLSLSDNKAEINKAIKQIQNLTEAEMFLLSLSKNEVKINKAIKQIQNSTKAEMFLLSLSKNEAEIKKAIGQIKEHTGKISRHTKR